MSYTLIGSVRSPFVRICRLFMLRNQIPFQFEVLNFLDDPKSAALLAQKTPINKVPLLVDGEKTIFDSRVIINHLIKKHQLDDLSLDDENRVTSIYSCMDAGVALFLLRKDGANIEQDSFFLTRNRQRIPDNLEYLSGWVESLDTNNPGHWYYPQMSLYSFLYWAEKRDIIKTSDYPVMQNFLERYSQLPGVLETGF